MLKRTITAFLIGPLSLLCIYLGGLSLIFLVWIMAILVVNDLFHLFGKNFPKSLKYVTFGIITLFLWSTHFPQSLYFFQHPMVVLLIIGFVLFNLFELKTGRSLWVDVTWFVPVRIIIMVGLVFSYFCLLRNADHGILHLMFFCFVAWGGDTFALIVGKYFGKRPLAIKISPNKTIEGAAGGFLGSLFFAACFIIFFDLDPLLYVFFAIVISILGQLGDLYESLLKRHFNVKDMSNFLPGHGGMYDRTDSSMLGIAIFYFMTMLL